MAIEKVTLDFTGQRRLEIAVERITSGYLMTMPTINLTGQEYQLMIRWIVPNTDVVSTKLLETGLEDAFGNYK